MKKVPYRTLEDAVTSTQGYFTVVIDSKFFAVCISSHPAYNFYLDITIFSDLDARKFLRVPVLAGTNQNEGDLYFIAEQLATLGFTMPVLTEMMSDVLGQASQNSWMSEDNLKLTTSPFLQLQFTCPTSKTVSDRVGAGVPTWRYQYQGNLFYTFFSLHNNTNHSFL
jgi:carboxylesterase type B